MESSRVQRDQAVERLAGQILTNEDTVDPELMIDRFCQVASEHGIAWRNLAGRVVRLLERQSAGMREGRWWVDGFIAAMKRRGVNSPVLVRRPQF